MYEESIHGSFPGRAIYGCIFCRNCTGLHCHRSSSEVGIDTDKSFECPKPIYRVIPDLRFGAYSYFKNVSRIIVSKYYTFQSTADSSYLILSYLILSYLILSYLILSYLILSYLILFCCAGQPDVDCVGDALCCFDGCANVCVGGGENTTISKLESKF
jgi:hypothetical protein